MDRSNAFWVDRKCLFPGLPAKSYRIWNLPRFGPPKTHGAVHVKKLTFFRGFFAGFFACFFAGFSASKRIGPVRVKKLTFFRVFFARFFVSFFTGFLASFWERGCVVLCTATAAAGAPRATTRTHGTMRPRGRCFGVSAVLGLLKNSQKQCKITTPNCSTQRPPAPPKNQFRTRNTRTSPAPPKNQRNLAPRSFLDSSGARGWDFGSDQPAISCAIQEGVLKYLTNV